MSTDLRTATIRLAYENPELRPVLLPLLTKQAAKKGDLLKVVKAMRFHLGNRRKTFTLPVGATVELIEDKVGGGAWAVLFPAGLPKAEWDGHIFPIFKSDHENFVLATKASE
jgi:ribosomal protein L2